MELNLLIELDNFSFHNPFKRLKKYKVYQIIINLVQVCSGTEQYQHEIFMKKVHVKHMKVALIFLKKSNVSVSCPKAFQNNQRKLKTKLSVYLLYLFCVARKFVKNNKKYHLV